MNRIHGRFEIANDDYLYVLSTMVFEPIRWNARFGWRPLLDAERLATFSLLAGGRRADGRSGTSRRTTTSSSGSTSSSSATTSATPTRATGSAVATRDMFLDWFPGLPKRVGRPLVHALLDRSCSRRSACRLRRHGFAQRPRRRCAHVRAHSVSCRRGAGRGSGRSSATAATPTATSSSAGLAARRRTVATLTTARPRSSEDRAGAFEAPCAGSIPAGATHRRRRAPGARLAARRTGRVYSGSR